MAVTAVRAASSGDVVEGKLHAVEVEGLRVLLSRIDGQVHAVVNRCPHMGMRMTRGKVEAGILQCPWHGSRFDLCTGRNVDWVNAFAGIPMPGWTHTLIAMGRAPASLQVLDVEERADGVFVNTAAGA